MDFSRQEKGLFLYNLSEKTHGTLTQEKAKVLQEKGMAQRHPKRA